MPYVPKWLAKCCCKPQINEDNSANYTIPEYKFRPPLPNSKPTDSHSVSLTYMGFHGYIQSKSVPLEYNGFIKIPDDAISKPSIRWIPDGSYSEDNVSDINLRSHNVRLTSREVQIPKKGKSVTYYYMHKDGQIRKQKNSIVSRKQTVQLPNDTALQTTLYWHTKEGSGSAIYDGSRVIQLPLHWGYGKGNLNTN